MSIFKTKGIIIKKISVLEKDVIYDIFTYDFWRIKAKKKAKTREKSLDLGYIINFEVETKEWKDIHSIRNIKILSDFAYEWENFMIIHEYLRFLHTIIIHIPLGIWVKEVFQIVEAVNLKKKISAFKINLARIKILEIVGILECLHSDREIRKILEFIRISRIDDILKLKTEDERIIWEILRIK